uniref:thioredoxin-dependent peroxiredoxin n=1 Tax=Chromera velia CCMP2878 TaxID=1169474 RepID=A0A0G4GLD1_9ALVE|mmetsp:Transcript_2993/g.6124  ORF Transcript_2993/g.6124 Transcript_2993/m.6124 type:complete len:193 (+) Transcript_2993:152-730(+)|eukprot:Cvel_4867.t1-p1 / transcript=Cvel_4867.t1 / gene=Cvel_4867 / organism=Chromera_velia_CCMP2878 / gene_product=Peroxiredoxin C1773.02c, putative / transcript_product=Peroxiredoxin C1773.02c, putative / location=Cvel_scaffold219:97301-98554(+) / protein_length=192 / sequence_SO=supercontig / SO=protein_coding / is_pseudo=false
MAPKRAAKAKQEPKAEPKKATKRAKPDSETESAPASKKTKGGDTLAVGKLCPDCEVVKEDGTETVLSALWKDSGVVLFFYPKANTPGCTKQACGFRDDYSKFVKAGYTVFGMSADSSKSQTTWKTKYSLPYSLLSDLSKDRKGLKALGVNKPPASIVRSHIVIEKGGTVKEICHGVSPKDSFEGALKTCTAK